MKRKILNASDIALKVGIKIINPMTSVGLYSWGIDFTHKVGDTVTSYDSEGNVIIERHLVDDKIEVKVVDPGVIRIKNKENEESISIIDFNRMLAFVTRKGKSRYRRVKVNLENEYVTVFEREIGSTHLGYPVFNAYISYVNSIVVS